MPIRPPKGSSNSRIKKIAPETASAETIKARMVVALGGASTLNPRKMTTSQETRMMSIACETEGTDCAASSERSWPRSVAKVAACDLRADCISFWVRDVEWRRTQHYLLGSADSGLPD